MDLLQADHDPDMEYGVIYTAVSNRDELVASVYKNDDTWFLHIESVKGFTTLPSGKKIRNKPLIEDYQTFELALKEFKIITGVTNPRIFKL